jgi:hypothetical protein
MGTLMATTVAEERWTDTLHRHIHTIALTIIDNYLHLQFISQPYDRFVL